MLAPAAEAFGSGLMSALLATNVDPVPAPLVAVNSFIFKATLSSERLFPLLRAFEVQAPASRVIGEDDLERSPPTQGSEILLCAFITFPGG